MGWRKQVSHESGVDLFIDTRRRNNNKKKPVGCDYIVCGRCAILDEKRRSTWSGGRCVHIVIVFYFILMYSTRVFLLFTKSVRARGET